MTSPNYTKAAAMFCQNPRFRSFLNVRSGRPVETVDQAAQEVRLACDVMSRRLLNTCPLARCRWEGLVTEFNQFLTARK